MQKEHKTRITRLVDIFTLTENGPSNQAGKTRNYAKSTRSKKQNISKEM
jgi:hypothetical protein